MSTSNQLSGTTNDDVIDWLSCDSYMKKHADVSRQCSYQSSPYPHGSAALSADSRNPWQMHAVAICFLKRIHVRIFLMNDQSESVEETTTLEVQKGFVAVRGRLSQGSEYFFDTQQNDSFIGKEVRHGFAFLTHYRANGVCF
jgi:hypothetical protein